ncbi:MAG: hypothetical protein HQ582_00570 [Planctomycetes bacterium]|nr:hypothetical protein [Planctomycetota bacterium]
MRLMLSVILVVGVAGQARSARPQAGGEHEEPESAQVETNPFKLDGPARLEYIMAAAGEYEIYWGGVDGESLTLIGPVLRFSDGVTGVVDAAVLLWTHNNRPRMAASFWYRGPSQTEHHEFQSLSTEKLTAKRKGRAVWRPSRPGIQMKPHPGAPAPAESAAGRLVQMRSLARQFTASITDRTGRQQLRLISQPVYRFAQPDEGILDGALFAFAKGTNPEVILLLEAIEGEAGDQWYSAFARMTVRQIEVRRAEEVAWQVPALRWPGFTAQEGPYIEIGRHH